MYNNFVSQQMYLDNRTDFGTQRTKEELMCEKGQNDVLTVREMQDILKIGTNSAYNLIHSKSFPVIKIGQSYRIPAAPFYAWLESPNAAEHQG